MNAGVIGPGLRKRGRAAAGGIGPAVRAPLGLGVKRAPNPAVTRMCGTWKPCRGPGTAWQADREESRTPRRDRMPKKRMPVAERRRETPVLWLAPPLAAGDNWPDTSRVAGP